MSRHRGGLMGEMRMLAIGDTLVVAHNGARRKAQQVAHATATTLRRRGMADMRIKTKLFPETLMITRLRGETT